MKKVSDIFKEKSDKNLQDNLEGHSGLFLFRYSGVASSDLTSLRRDLKGSGAKMFIAKNSFINLSLKKTDRGKNILDLIDGPTALVFVNDDPISPSKVLTEFVKTHDSVKLRGGFLGDRLINEQDFRILAKIPSRDILYQQIAVALNGPITKLAIELKQIIAKLAYALKAVSDKKEKQK